MLKGKKLILIKLDNKMNINYSNEYNDRHVRNAIYEHIQHSATKNAIKINV